MKRGKLKFYTTVLLSTLFLTSCKHYASNSNFVKIRGQAIFYNVSYYYDRDYHKIKVDYDKDGKADISIDPRNVIKQYATYLDENGNYIYNEFLIDKELLFVYKEM